MKKLLLLLSLISFSSGLKSQSLYFPPLTGTTWDTISPATLGWCPDKVDTLLNYLEDKNSKAFILLKDGKIVIEKYFGTFTRDSLWYWASAGKTLTAFMVGMAQQQGLLSISDTTSDYLGQGWTNCTPAQEEKITIRHQLTMTSGLDDGVPDHYCTLDTCLNYLADAGTRWAYHNGPYTMLDSVVEVASGQSFNSYIQQNLKNPTGMTGVFLPSGYNNVFFSNARSMARFGLLMLNRGTWNSNAVMTDTAYFNQMVNTSQNLNNAYGYLWWLNGKTSFMVPGLQFVFPGTLSPSAPNDMIAALGKNGQIINVVPSQNLVYIRMGNAPGVGEVPILFNDTVWMKLNDAMCSTSGITNQIRSESDVRVYPNPAQNICTIELPGIRFDVVLYDFMGRIIDQRQNCPGKTDLHTAQYPQGIYIVQLTTATGQVLKRKLVVER